MTTATPTMIQWATNEQQSDISTVAFMQKPLVFENDIICVVKLVLKQIHKSNIPWPFPNGVLIMSQVKQNEGQSYIALTYVGLPEFLFIEFLKSWNRDIVASCIHWIVLMAINLYWSNNCIVLYIFKIDLEQLLLERGGSVSCSVGWLDYRDLSY